MTKTAIALVALSLGLLGCQSKPTAMTVCEKIVGTGVGRNCHASQPVGLAAAATERAEFELVSVPGEGGSVFRFDRDNFYDSTVDSYAKMSTLAGPHRYGSRKALVFVQMNEKLAAADGAKVKAIVDGL